jgi:hypothetical protein
MNMTTTLNKIASVLAFLIGAISIAAGAKAIQGWDPGYSVLNWLPMYNFGMGVLTVLIPTVLLWRNSLYARITSIMVFGIHAVVTGFLLTAFQGMVAQESIIAMLFRLAVWVIILALMFFSQKKQNDSNVRILLNGGR